MNGYVEAGYAIVLASLAGYALRLVGRRRLLERALPPVPAGTEPDNPVSAAPVPGSPVPAVTAPHPAPDDPETTWP